MLSDDLLLHGLSHTTIGAGAFHFRVRDGIGWFHTADVTEQAGEARVSAALAGDRDVIWFVGSGSTRVE